MTRDTLSSLLRSVRFRGAVFYNVSCRDEWSAEALPRNADVRAVMPSAETVMACHMIAKGTCWAEVAGSPRVELNTGDVVIFPHGDAHVLSSAPGLRSNRSSADWASAERGALESIPIALHNGVVEPGTASRSDAADTVMVSGFWGYAHQPFNPLALALPRMVHLPASKTAGWLERMMEQAVAESRQRRAGGAAVLERLSETMFVDSVLRYLDSLPEGNAGWLAGLRDEFVGRALAAMHADPSAPWTLKRLGEAAGISRSALHDRFLHVVGCAPMHYLTQFRLQVASNLLQTSDEKVETIATAVGYDSGASFTRAFKRATGLPPATWRREWLAS